jgi:hypothetical protein
MDFCDQDDVQFDILRMKWFVTAGREMEFCSDTICSKFL